VRDEELPRQRAGPPRAPLATLLTQKSGARGVPNCPECVAKDRNALVAKHEGEEGVDLTAMLDAVAVPMKADPATKHFTCRRCGLYATREQISDLRDRINRRARTREDHQYDYLDWWQKSKKDKQVAQG